MASRRPPKHTLLETLRQLDFDIHRYDACSELDAAGWARVLSLRVVGWTITSGSIDESHWLKAIRNRFESPCKGGSERFGTKDAITDVGLHEAWNLRGSIDLLFPDAARECKEWPKLQARFRNKLRKFPDLADHFRYLMPLSLNDDLHALLVQRAAKSGSFDDQADAQTPLVRVDLTHTDNQLAEEFASWLRGKRAQMRSAKLPTPKRRKFTPADFRRWHRQRVLALIDLELLSKRLRLTLTDEMAGDLLFPNVGGAERVRKTVRPIARDLMRSETLSALGGQARWSRKPEGFFL